MVKKRYIRIIIFCLLISIFIFSCLTTNVPDKIEIIHKSEPIIVYQKYIANAAVKPNLFQYIKRELVPEQAMLVDFWYNIYGYYFNTNHLEMVARLFLTKQYEKLYIKEVSYIYKNKKHNLIIDTDYYIPTIKEDEILFTNENDEPIIINELNYYWISVDLNRKVKHHLINSLIGQEKEIEVIQIYSFDNEPLREEKYKYKVICGGNKI